MLCTGEANMTYLKAGINKGIFITSIIISGKIPSNFFSTAECHLQRLIQIPAVWFMKLCALVKCKEARKEPTGTIISNMNNVQGAIACMRASNTLYESQIQTANVHYICNVLYFPKCHKL
jgi:hypothetical protein